MISLSICKWPGPIEGSPTGCGSRRWLSRWCPRVSWFERGTATARSRVGDHYLYLATEWDAVRGGFRFAHVLGPDFLYFLCAPALVHITGTNKDGDEVAGMGVVVHRSHVLTCRHVVCDMKVHTRQTIQRKTYAISEESIHTHSEVDVAVIQVDGAPLTGFPGAIFQRPVVAQTVYTLGYPKLTGLREASVTMQQGGGDERVGDIAVGGKPVPVFRDLQTRQ